MKQYFSSYWISGNKTEVLKKKEMDMISITVQHLPCLGILQAAKQGGGPKPELKQLPELRR